MSSLLQRDRVVPFPGRSQAADKRNCGSAAESQTQSSGSGITLEAIDGSSDAGRVREGYLGERQARQPAEPLAIAADEGLSLAEASCYGALVNIACRCCGTRQKADLALLMRQYEPSTKLTAAFRDYACLKCWKRGEFAVFLVRREHSPA